MRFDKIIFIFIIIMIQDSFFLCTPNFYILSFVSYHQHHIIVLYHARYFSCGFFSSRIMNRKFLCLNEIYSFYIVLFYHNYYYGVFFSEFFCKKKSSSSRTLSPIWLYAYFVYLIQLCNRNIGIETSCPRQDF